MPRDAFSVVHELALDQHGYFTMDQARSTGVDQRAVVMMERRGAIERIAHGLYLDPLAPTSPLGPYMAAVLWPRGARGTLSHQTALEIMGVSDVSPDRIHMTIPKRMRVRRSVPRSYVLHHADLTPSDITLVEGIPVTTAARAIRDCDAAQLGGALIRQAIEDGRRTGRLSVTEANQLEQELLVRDGKGTK